MQRHLFPMIRGRVVEILHGYGVPEEIVNAIDDYIVPPALGEDSGIAGAFALALSALEEGRVTELWPGNDLSRYSEATQNHLARRAWVTAPSSPYAYGWP